jgi:hypothetical protein
LEVISNKSGPFYDSCEWKGSYDIIIWWTTNFDPLVLVVRINLEKYIPHTRTFIYHLTFPSCQNIQSHVYIYKQPCFSLFFSQLQELPFHHIATTHKYILHVTLSNIQQRNHQIHLLKITSRTCIIRNNMIDHLVKFGFLQTNDNLKNIYHPFLYCLQNDKFHQDHIQKYINTPSSHSYWPNYPWVFSQHSPFHNRLNNLTFDQTLSNHLRTHPSILVVQ